MNTSQQTVLITGGTSGIGLALARAFLAAGSQVIVTGRDQAKLAAVQSELPSIQTELADMSDYAALDRLAERCSAVTILINNAGVQYIYNLSDANVAIERIKQELDINLAGPLHLTCRMLPELCRKPSAAIVNISSSLAFAPKQSAPVYCASKAGMHAFTKTLRWQLEQTTVKVFEIIPPLVDTAMSAGRGSGKISPDELASAFLAAFARDEYEVRIGRARQLLMLQRLLPGFVERRMRGA